MLNEYDFVVVGGGAAGYFGAIACAEAHPGARIVILEATARVLTKVKISGGGRCNVTHQQFNPKQLTSNYPRGQKELIGPFHKFQPQDTIDWFEDHGVKLKAEKDGRMFPTSNNSQTIIDCLESAALNAGVVLQKNTLVQKIESKENKFEIFVKGSAETLKSSFVLLATGSMPYGVSLAASLGHTLTSPVPSLFTFQIQNPLIEGLAGISFPKVHLTLKLEDAQSFQQEGPCLITHWGLSGPAVLKLSAFAARELFKSNYQAQLKINWVPHLSLEQAFQKLETSKREASKKKIVNENPFAFMKRFWESILVQSGFPPELLFGEASKKQLLELAQRLTQSSLLVTGKGVFKEEFVTAGGVCRDEIDFRTMESKIHPGLYFAGEAIDIDGITGGFNFQNAWTGSWLAGRAVAQNINQ